MEHYNDQHQIAEELMIMDDHQVASAHLAHQQISTLHLSYSHAAYCKSRPELYALVKRKLLTYVTADFVLEQEKFFDNYCES